MNVEKINILINQIITNNHSMVIKPLFETVVRKYYQIASLEGDIVECGIAEGGFSIFLSHLFNNKKIWACDSFEGFQRIEDATYPNLTCRHDLTGELIERFQKTNDQLNMKFPLERVKNNFKNYNLGDDRRINFIKGFVNKTLPTINISKIALLRIDVDGYSPTRVVLDNLYDKVVTGGMIIFDDLCLVEAAEAVKDWMAEKGLSYRVFNPYDDQEYEIVKRIGFPTEIIRNHVDPNSQSGLHTGSYIIKK